MCIAGSGDKADPQTIELLTDGLLSRFMPALSKTKADLAELTENQRIQIETLLQENAKFTECKELEEVKGFFLFVSDMLTMIKYR